MTFKVVGAFIALILGIAACVDEKPADAIWWVNSFKVSCVGVAPMHCLQVHDGEGPFGEWRNLYQDIIGFDYRPGNLYRVHVRVIDLPASEVPADASSRRYELVDILENMPDPRAPLHDIYVVSQIDGNDIDRGLTQTNMEFNVVQQRYLGFDSCVEFAGPIIAVDGARLELGSASTSADECEPATGVNELLSVLPDVVAWRRDALQLELLDANGTTRVSLSKID